MMIFRKNRIPLFLLCAILALNPFLPLTAYAQEPEQKVVRVGWYESPFNYTDQNGRRSGYAYEYQQRIAAYTGWEYEYVDANWPELLEMVKTGEIDLMSDVSYTEERAAEMLFSSYPMGAEQYYVFIAVNNSEIKPGDFSSLNGKKVGINKGSFQEKLFLDWAEKNGVDTEIVELTVSDSEAVQMLAQGEIDALVTIDAYGDTSVCVPIIKVGESEFFFTITKNRPELLEELNYALSKIQDENKQYNLQIYDKYVRPIGTNAFLAADEIEWLSQHGAIRIGYLDGDLPFCDTEKGTGAFVGALSDYLEIASHTFQIAGIEYTATGYPSVGAALDALKAGEIDCVFPVSLSAFDGETLGVSATSILIKTADVPVTHTSIRRKSPRTQAGSMTM